MSDDAGQWYIERANAHPLPRELFMELLGVALEAMRGNCRAIPPDDERCLEDLPPNTLYLTDCPENQMGMSVIGECHRRFPKNQSQAEDTSFSFMFRWFALQKAKADGKPKEFTKPSAEPNCEMVNTAVFAAAAECPLVVNGGFDDSYTERVRKLMEEDDDGN